MGFSSVDSFIIAFSTRDPRSGGIAARRCFILGHPGLHHCGWDCEARGLCVRGGGGLKREGGGSNW